MELAMRAETSESCGTPAISVMSAVEGLEVAAPSLDHYVLPISLAVITPAISVLSAIEGLEIATPAIKPYVVPIAAGVLIALFAIQSRGVGKVGLMFWQQAMGENVDLVYSRLVLQFRAADLVDRLAPYKDFVPATDNYTLSSLVAGV